jgi:hypothetical protein
MGMLTFRDIIEEFGIKRLAEAFGVAESHVRTMKARDSIPPLYWGFLTELDREDERPRLTFGDIRAIVPGASVASKEGATA